MKEFREYLEEVQTEIYSEDIIATDLLNFLIASGPAALASWGFGGMLLALFGKDGKINTWLNNKNNKKELKRVLGIVFKEDDSLRIAWKNINNKIKLIENKKRLPSDLEKELKKVINGIVKIARKREVKDMLHKSILN